MMDIENLKLILEMVGAAADSAIWIVGLLIGKMYLGLLLTSAFFFTLFYWIYKLINTHGLNNSFKNKVESTFGFSFIYDEGQARRCISEIASWKEKAEKYDDEHQ